MRILSLPHSVNVNGYKSPYFHATWVRDETKTSFCLSNFSLLTIQRTSCLYFNYVDFRKFLQSLPIEAYRLSRSQEQTNITIINSQVTFTQNYDNGVSESQTWNYTDLIELKSAFLEFLIQTDLIQE